MDIKAVLLEKIKSHPNPEVRSLFKKQEYSKMFVVYSERLEKRLQKRRRAGCFRCGLGFHVGDVVVRRVLGGHAFYYHVECFLETLH